MSRDSYTPIERIANSLEQQNIMLRLWMIAQLEDKRLVYKNYLDIRKDIDLLPETTERVKQYLTILETLISDIANP